MPFLELVHEVMSTLAASLPVFVGVVIRGSLVVAFALVATSLMRRRSAAARHLVWVSSILIALAIPALGSIAPHWDTQMLPAMVTTLDAGTGITAPLQRAENETSAARSTEKPSAMPALPRDMPVVSAGTFAPDAPLPLLPPRVAPEAAGVAAGVGVSDGRATGWSIRDWAALLWLALALGVLARFCIGRLAIARTARRAARVDDPDWHALVNRVAQELGVSRPVMLLRGEDQIVPVTWGIVYPVVLLPEAASAWQPDRREAVIVHELAHVARLDALTQMVMQLALAVFWFNPLFWIAAKHIRTERERACDDLVLSHGTRASFYADDLLAMVRTLTRNSEPAFAALAMARRSEFEGRMLAILDPRTDRRRVGRRGRVIAVCASIVIALPLAALRPLPRTSSTSTPELPRTSVATVNARGSGVGGHVAASCGSRTGNHVSINSNDTEATYVLSNNGRCLIVRTTGKVAFTDDDARVKSISGGGHVSITERIGNQERRYEASPAGAGVRETYYVDNKPASLDAVWLRSVIVQLVRQDASYAPARDARIRARSGVAGVLAEIDSISGDYAKSAYFDALLGEPGLTADSLHLITRRGVAELTSDYYKAGFLRHVAGMSHDAATTAAIADAATSVSSDYYRNELLQAVLAGSGADEATVRQAISASADMTSDYYRHDVLAKVLARQHLSDDLLLAVIASANHLASDYYRGAVLDSIAREQSLASKNVSAALLKGIDGIPSSYTHARVLQTIVGRSDLSPALAIGAIADVATLTSDYDKARILSAVASRPVMKDAAVRNAFFESAKRIQSATYYRQATAAALP